MLSDKSYKMFAFAVGSMPHGFYVPRSAEDIQALAFTYVTKLVRQIVRCCFVEGVEPSAEAKTNENYYEVFVVFIVVQCDWIFLPAPSNY